MAEQWRALAGRVPAILDKIGAVDEGTTDARLPEFIHDASLALRLRWDDLDTFRRGVPDVLDSLHACPSLFLCRAIEVLGHDHALHCVGARFLALYGEHLGFLQAQPAPVTQPNLVFLPGQGQMANANAWWENWLQSRLDAFNTKLAVSRRMRLAAAYDAGINDALILALQQPVGSPDRHAWIRAAELLVLDAMVQASEAEHHAYKMRLAVTMESFCATAILRLT